jgi:hypothetical protein
MCEPETCDARGWCLPAETPDNLLQAALVSPGQYRETLRSRQDGRHAMADRCTQGAAVAERQFHALLNAEITGADKLGVWLRVGGVSYFVAHEKMQWLRDPAVRRMLNLNLPNGMHLRWDSLDQELDIDAL